MSVEEIKAAGQRSVEEIWNKGNLDIIPEIIVPNYVYHPATGDDVKGIEGFRQMVVNMRTACPDLHYTIDSSIVEGDIGAARLTLTGTFTGKVGDMEPTGKKFTQKSAIFNRMEGGKVVEAWGYSDSLGLYRQLGIPIPSQ